MSNVQANHASPSNVLCPKPFSIKGGVSPLVGVPNISSDVLKQKLASMNSLKGKTADNCHGTDKPNVQPKPLAPKPSLKAVVPKKPMRTTDEASATNAEDSKAMPEIITGRPKSNSVQESISKFESPAKERPKPLPKSARFSQKKPDNNPVTEKQQSNETEQKPVISEQQVNTVSAPVRPARPKKSPTNSETDVPILNALNQEMALNMTKNNKPLDVQVPSYPKDLDAWITQYVLTNSKLSPLANINRLDKMKTETESSHSSLDTQSCHSADEIYDDVMQNGSPAEKKVSNDHNSDIYDDAENSVPEQERQKENTTSEVENNRVNHTYSVYEVQNEDKDENGNDEMLYEPVETIQNIMNTNDSIPSNPSEEIEPPRDKRKEEKERKEKEKKERKEKDRMEKERKKEEKEEKKRKAKERKMFSLKPDEELRVIEKHYSLKEFKGKDKDLTYSIHECIEIISKDNCPKGRWLAQTADKKLGYVIVSELGITEHQQSNTSPDLPARIPTEDELDEQGELYEAIDLSIAPDLPPERVPRVATQEDIYDDIG